MKDFDKKMKKIFNTVKKNIIYFFKNNVLFATFVISSLINGILLRCLTVKNYFNISPVLADVTFILLVGSFGYLFKPKNRFKYYIIWSIIFTMVCLINSIYYTNYVSFTSFSLLATSVQIFGVSDALQTIMELKDFCYIWAPLSLIFVHVKLKKIGYYKKIKVGKKYKLGTLKCLLAAGITLCLFLTTLTGTDISRLYKQWNREYVVMKFGIYVYQANDLITSLKPQISPLFGYDKAAKEFREYYDENKNEKINNEYTDIFKGKNVIVIHAESIQNYLLETKINDIEIVPNLKRLASEGMYFSNFYSQESVGTSSDTEFTFSTSLLPASSGTVFVSYYDRYYPSIQKQFKDDDYYVFSMHANKGNYWNREAMHKSLGYDTFYYYDKDYELDDMLGLGLSDKSFFRQSSKLIKGISEKKNKFYGLMIMLTNHTPFDGVLDQTDLDLTYKYIKKENDEEIETVNNYLKDTTLGRYFTTAHYADEAIGEFINELDEEGVLDDTVIVIYGDHDAKIKRSEYDYYYNYNPETDSKRDKEDPEYHEFTKYDYELNRKVPFIIWTKNEDIKKKINKEIKTVTGMYDVFPTLANMMGVKNSKYALGHDVFSTDDHLVVFPNSNWVTDKMYYDSQNGEAITLDANDVITPDYIEKYTKVAEDQIAVSNDIIVHDLIKKTKESEKILKEANDG